MGLPAARMRRRDLLRLKSSSARAEINSRGNDRAGAGEVIRAHRAAMGSYFEVILAAHTPGGAELAVRALDLIDQLEAQLTVYRPDSEISRLNDRAHAAPVPIEARLFELLRRANELHRETNGAYDVAAGALSEAWGFVRGPKRVPDAETLARAVDRSGFEHVSLDPETTSVSFDRPGVVINLGSIGKGYAIDRAIELIRAWFWPTPALVHAGQSSCYALGSPPDNFGGRWQVALHDPFGSNQQLGGFWLRNRGLGTSGGEFQRFENAGRVYSHLLDPRAGEPCASVPASVSVTAPSAAEADALSTAFAILGPERTAEYIQTRAEISALFVLDNPKRMLAINLGEAEFEPALLPVMPLARIGN